MLGGSAPPPDRPPNSVATYGMTETGSGVVYDGIPLAGVEVRVADGELLVRGPMVAAEYRDGTPVVDADGWLHTGDLGSVTDGVVSVVDRLRIEALVDRESRAEVDRPRHDREASDV